MDGGLMAYFGKCEDCGKTFNDRSVAEAHKCPEEES